MVVQTEIDVISISKADFVESAKTYLSERKYFVSTLNSETIRQFFGRIHAVLTGIHTGDQHNRVSVILTGSKQCGKTTLMKHTVDFLSALPNKICCAVYFECEGDQHMNTTPTKLLLNRAQELSLLNADEIRVLQQSKNSIQKTLDAFRSKSIVPLVFYDEADLLWAKHQENFLHSIGFIDQLHAIGNNGYAFGCLSGSTWKLASLALKKEFKESSKCHRFDEYQNLNPQKYSELPLYPLTDPHDACSFLALDGQNVSLEDAAARIVVTGGRFQCMRTPETIHVNIFDFDRGGLEWAIWDIYLSKNENLLCGISDDQAIHQLLQVESVGRATLAQILSERHFECTVDDLVDKDLLVPEPGNPHYFLPACIHCVYQLWKYERSQDLSIDLMRALRYPAGRPHAELLEWYCHVDSIYPSMEYISLTPPGEGNRSGRAVHVVPNMTMDDIRNLATLRKRLKPFYYTGVDMIQLRLARGKGRWPKTTIFIDCIQIKLSDQSTISETMAEEIAKALLRVQGVYVQALCSKMSIFNRVTCEAGDLYLHCTWGISGPAASVFSDQNIVVVEGKNITWHNKIISFCQREQITWIKY
jgi:hypothetical protein